MRALAAARRSLAVLMLGTTVVLAAQTLPTQDSVEASARRMVAARARRASLQTGHAPASVQRAHPAAPQNTMPDESSARAAGDPIGSLLHTGSSSPWSIVIGLTLLTLLPALLLSVTPMVRLLVVFHFLRQALGTQTAPSNQILMGLALMMTWFLMAPVLTQVEADATTPYRNGTITGEVALERGLLPVKSYMLRFAREKDLAIFVAAAMPERPRTPSDLPIQVVVPAYILSELKAGFQIGAVLFLPFLLVDIVVASVTTSIGMLQLPPVVISTPVKILLFVMVDGWNLLADRLLKSF